MSAHEHHPGCSLGAPDCPAFGEERGPRHRGHGRWGRFWNTWRVLTGEFGPGPAAWAAAPAVQAWLMTREDEE